MTQSSNNHLLLFRVQGPYRLILTIHVTTALWDKETSKILNSRLTARCFEDFSVRYSCAIVSTCDPQLVTAG